jgi:ketosteroid isomerase-like protein
MRGKAAFAEAQSQLQGADLAANSKIQEIKVFGEWAYVWTELSVVVTPRNGGEAIERRGNTLSILQKQAGVWFLFRDANMLAPVQQ